MPTGVTKRFLWPEPFLGVLPVWANLRQRALDIAIAEINKKMDLNIVVESLERSLHRRVDALNFAIKTQAVTGRRCQTTKDN